MDEDSRPLRLLLGVALASIVVGGTVDLILDRPRSWMSFHVVFELLMVAGALVMATTLWFGWWRAERDVRHLQRSLAERSEERDAWRASANQVLEGLGRAIDEQFRAWQLTPTEREVALLLLKGHSHKAIARRSGRSDATVRQHAGAVYQKASLAGRAELAAYFLEDLVLPDADRESLRVQDHAPPGDG